MTEMKPVFQHDCPKCVFVKRWNDHDVYTCTPGGMVTIVARWGNGGPEYSSKSIFLDNLALKDNA